MSDTKVRLTGLWRNEAENGSTYLLGNISPSSRLLVLENQFKESEGDPDYIAFIAKNQKNKEEEEPQEKEREEVPL